jgi:hypothetical protein
MTADNDAAVQRDLQRIRQARRDDSRMRRVNEGTPRKPFWRITCAQCGTCLTVGEDVDMALALARRNATKRPCCFLWETPA